MPILRAIAIGVIGLLFLPIFWDSYEALRCVGFGYDPASPGGCDAIPGASEQGLASVQENAWVKGILTYAAPGIAFASLIGVILLGMREFGYYDRDEREAVGDGDAPEGAEDANIWGGVSFHPGGMLLVGWIFVWELGLIYFVPYLDGSAGIAAALLLLLIGIGCGYEGALGVFWQRVAWTIAAMWYVSSMPRYALGLDSALTGAELGAGGFFDTIVPLLYIVIVPLSWWVAMMAEDIPHWMGELSGDDD